MTSLLASLTIPFAVHIGQDMIRPEWCVGGLLVAVLLMVWGAWGIRDEEIPGVAVLGAAFFVASSIHVPVPGGPPAHLLLTGLVGVVLGRRSALAIPVGLFLQAVLFQHGALSALGANVCVMTPPALISWLLFRALCRSSFLRRAWFRAALVMVSALTFVLSGVYAVTLLVTNWGTDVKVADRFAANEVTFHPAVLLLGLGVGLAAAWLERRSRSAVEFPVGLVIGELSVFLTLLLNALFLILGGSARWDSMVLLFFLIQLPLAVLEGIILGFTVGFLARVKPEMLPGYRRKRSVGAAPRLLTPSAAEPSVVKSSALLVSIIGLLASPSLVHAHALNATWRLLPDQRIQVQSFFPAGNPPRDATATVSRADSSVLAEGDLDDKGFFVFHYDRAEDLRVVIRAAAGTIDEHTAVVNISAKELGGSDTNKANEATFVANLKEYLIGIGFLLAAAAFVLSVRNARQLRALKRMHQAQPSPAPVAAEPESSLTGQQPIR